MAYEELHSSILIDAGVVTSDVQAICEKRLTLQADVITATRIGRPDINLLREEAHSSGLRSERNGRLDAPALGVQLSRTGTN